MCARIQHTNWAAHEIYKKESVGGLYPSELIYMRPNALLSRGWVGKLEVGSARGYVLRGQGYSTLPR